MVLFAGINKQSMYAMCAGYVARKTDFERHGGIDLLIHVISNMTLGQVVQVPDSAPVDVGGNQPLPEWESEPGDIVGSWTIVGIGSMFEMIDDDGNIQGNDYAASGTQYMFKADGTYEAIYYAEVVSGYCVSTTRAYEKGSYTFDCRKLQLTPDGYEHQTCLCGCSEEEKREMVQSEAPPRSYEVAIHPSKRAMVFRGYCAPYMTHTACNSVENLGTGNQPDLLHDETFRRD